MASLVFLMKSEKKELVKPSQNFQPELTVSISTNVQLNNIGVIFMLHVSILMVHILANVSMVMLTTIWQILILNTFSLVLTASFRVFHATIRLIGSKKRRHEKSKLRHKRV